MATLATGDRRIDLARAENFDLGAARVRPSLLEIALGGTSELVEPRVMQMLVALHRARGAPVTRDELIGLCWGGLAVSDDAITQCVSKLRRALSDVPGATVASVPRIGYRLVCEARSGPVPERSFRAVSTRAAAFGAVIAAISVLGFDSASVATVGGSAGAKPPEQPASRTAMEADRLHEAAVRLFRERSRPGYAEAETLLRRGIVIDPQHAPSWARLAMAVYAPYWWKEKEDPEARARLRSEAIGYARRALSIDPRLAEAHQAIGFILRHDGGLRWLERAAALDPDNPEIRDMLANMLENGLELRRANAELTRAVQLEPTSQHTVFLASSMLDRLGRRTEADSLIDNFEEVTNRTADARFNRFELQFARGDLVRAAALASESLDAGDEDRWWRQWRLFDIATALGDEALRDRLLRLQPRLAAIDYTDARLAISLAHARPDDWWASPVVGALARQLMMSGNGNLLLTLYDDRYDDVGDLWKEQGDWADCVAPPLILAMRQAGRAGEAIALRNRFAADIGKLAAEGDATSALLVWRAELAALDGNSALAARWLDAAVSAGWKGQGAYRVGFDPDRDPLFGRVRDGPEMQRAIARRRAAAAAEAATLKKLNLLARPWASSVRRPRRG